MLEVLPTRHFLFNIVYAKLQDSVFTTPSFNSHLEAPLQFIHYVLGVSREGEMYFVEVLDVRMKRRSQQSNASRARCALFCQLPRQPCHTLVTEDAVECSLHPGSCSLNDRLSVLDSEFL